MKKLLNIFFLISGFAFSQNLVPNGDFEGYSKLPNNCDQVDRLYNWQNVTPDSAFEKWSPDFYHTFGYKSNSTFGIMKPFSGEGQMGLATYYHTHTNFREFVATKLKEPLKKGEKYVLSFYLTNGSGNTWTYRTNFGALFTKKDPMNHPPHSRRLFPQCEINETLGSEGTWKKYTFSFTADIEYEYVTFGNFRQDDNVTLSDNGKEGGYYCIDKIELVSEKNYRPDGEKLLEQNAASTETQTTKEPEEKDAEGQKYEATSKRFKTSPVKENARAENRK